MNTQKHILPILAAAALALALPAKAEGVDGGTQPADPGMKVAAGEDGHDHAGEHGHDDATHYEAKSFASVKEAWSFLAAKVPEAEGLAASKSLDPLHELGEQMASAVHTLEEKSDMVAGDAKTKLASALKQLDKAADDLHHAAEAKDADGAQISVKKMKGLLPLVQGLYPAGALN